jgi:addiction module HigA family antidote
VLFEEFLELTEISQKALARAIRVPPRRVNEVVLGMLAVTADTSLRFARFFGTSEKIWVDFQADNDQGGRQRSIHSRELL